MPVPDFSPGEVLTAAAMDSIGLWLVNTTTLAAETTKQINDCFIADFANYLIIGNLISNADATLIYRMVDGTTPNAGNNTTMSGSYRSWANGNYNGNFQAANTFGFLSYCDTALGCGFEANVFRPQLAATTFLQSTFTDGDFNGDFFNRHAVSTTYEGIQITTSSGTAQLTGTIRVYGYRN